MKVFVLAGGHATRMFPYDITEKSMLPIGGKPIVRIIIERLLMLHACEEEDVVICCLGKHLDIFKHEFRDMPAIQYSPKIEAIGTASHYYYAAEVEQQLLPDEPVLIHYADCLTDMDYGRMIQNWRPEGAECMIYVTKNVRHDYSEVQIEPDSPLDLVKSEFKNGVLTAINTPVKIVDDFVEKPKMAYYTWTGIAIMRHGAIKELMGNRILAKAVDFGHDVLPALTAKSKLYAYKTEDAWLDAGTAHNYRKLRELSDRGELFV